MYLIEKDKMEVVSAVLETASYLLLRRSNEAEKRDNINSNSLVEVFFASLKWYFSVEQATSNLIDAVSRNVSLMLSPTSESILFRISTYFWNESDILNVMLSDENNTISLCLLKNLSCLLRHITPSQEEDKQPLLSWCKVLFHKILTIKTGCVLLEEEADALFEALNFCSPKYILDIQDIERFCVNELLFWIISCSRRGEENGVHVDTRTAACLFKILSLLLHCIPSIKRQGDIFEIILKEIESSGAAIYLISMCLTIISNEGAKNSLGSLLRCQAIDDLGLKIGKLAADIKLDDDIYTKEVYTFLRLITGLNNGSNEILLSTATVNELASIVLGDYTDTASILFHIFSDITIEGSLSIDNLRTSIIIKSWENGGEVWQSKILMFLRSSNIDRLMHKDIEDSLLRQLSCSLSSEDASYEVERREILSKKWAEKAWRYFELKYTQKKFTGTSQCFVDIEAIYGIYPIDMIGMGSYELWREEYQRSAKLSLPSFAFLCLVNFLNMLYNDASRFTFTTQTSKENHNIILFVSILLAGASSETEPKYGQIHPSLTKSLLNTIVEKTRLGDKFLEASSLEVLERMKSMDCITIPSAIIALDVLLGLRFGAIVYHDTSVVDPTTVKQGDMYLYKANDGEKIEIKISKIHHDDFPNLYFTICETNTGKEKQTVSSRLEHLKRQEKVKTDLSAAQIENSFVQVLEDVDGGSTAFNLAIAEGYNLIIGRLGLLGNVGIGSPRYEVHRKISQMMNEVNSALSCSVDSSSAEMITNPSEEMSISNITYLLRRVTLAMGGERLSEPMYSNFLILRIDPVYTIERIHNFFRSPVCMTPSFSEFSSVVLNFISKSIKSVRQDSVLRNIMALLNVIAPELLSFETSFDLEPDRIRHEAYSLLNTLKLVKQQGRSIGITDWNDASVRVTFAPSLLIAYLELQYSGLDRLFVDFMLKKDNQCGLINSCVINIERLYLLLLDSNRRTFGLWLISQVAARGIALYDEGVIYNGSVTDQLSQLPEDEAEGILEDIQVIARYLPAALITSIETSCSLVDQPTNTMMSWITLLRFAQGVMSDSLIFNAISSYIRATNAVDHILSLCIKHASLNNKDKSWKSMSNGFIEDKHTSDEEFISKLATFVFYLTVQVLPNLSKTWFINSCPRGKQKIVSNFVEYNVAPENLKKQLDNIQSCSSSLGDMVVNGSCVSREIIATYVQDEVKN